MVADVFGIVGNIIAGAYRVEAVVAEGGFSVVYRAEHQGFKAPVALKCLKLPEKLSTERQTAFLAQFRAEGELLFELSASIPTVVRPLHIDALTTDDGTFVPYMVLEWLQGETLSELMERRGSHGRASIPIRKLVRLLAPAADALARAHNFSGRAGAVSVVHCDIKPENIFIAKVGGDEMVKVLDFGVAKAQSVASQVAGRATGRRAGAWFTPAFAAPEQWRPEQYGAVGPWTDVWGLALTMVESLAGRAALDGDANQMMAAALSKDSRPTPKTLGVGLDAAGARRFARGLAVGPRERQRDVGVFWDELTGALGMRETRSRDARREAGSVPREEVIEAAIPAAARAAPAPPRPPPPRPAPPRPGGQTRATLGIDDPFAEDDLAVGPAGLGPDLEAPLPSVPAPAPNVTEASVGSDFGGEAPLPSIPPVPRGGGFGSEAALPSIPPAGQAAAVPAEATQAVPSFDFELEAPPPPPSSARGRAPPPPPAAPAVEHSDPQPPKATPAQRAAFGGEAPLPSVPMPLRTSDIDLDDRGPSLPTRAEARHAFQAQMAAASAETKPPLPLLKIGLGLVGAAIVIGLGGRVYQGTTGEALAAGPVSATLVAGLLLAAGLGLLVFHLLPKDH